MTGFGVARRLWQPPGEPTSLLVVVEARSVNARYLELKIRHPFGAAFDGMLRKHIETQLSRGRVDLTIQVERTWPRGAEPPQQHRASPVQLRDDLAWTAFGLEPHQVEDVLDIVLDVQRIATQRGFELSRPNPLEILRFTASHRSPWIDPEREPPPFLGELVAAALDELTEFRRAEGLRIQAELEQLAEALARQLANVEQAIAGESERLAERLTARARELCARLEAPLPDPQRVAQEVAMLVMQGDVTEEQARIASHVAAMRQLLCTPARPGQGKTLDFLAQELLREVTTIGSKITSHVGSAIVIETKGTIERLREQAQNVE